MNITRQDAIVIVEMAEVCYGEGIGPDYDQLLHRIIEHFPDMKDTFSISRMLPPPSPAGESPQAKAPPP
jgi:hypothetical protein